VPGFRDTLSSIIVKLRILFRDTSSSIIVELRILFNFKTMLCEIRTKRTYYSN